MHATKRKTQSALNDVLHVILREESGVRRVIRRSRPNAVLSTLRSPNVGADQAGAKVVIKFKNSIGTDKMQKSTKEGGTKGTLTTAATKAGKGVQEYAGDVLAHKERYSPKMVKKAVFAKNFSGRES
jgi:hypothetical protein